MRGVNDENAAALTETPLPSNGKEARAEHPFVRCRDGGCSQAWCHYRNSAGALVCPMTPDQHEPPADGRGTGDEACNGNCMPAGPLYDVACPWHGTAAMKAALDTATAPTDLAGGEG